MIFTTYEHRYVENLEISRLSFHLRDGAMLRGGKYLENDTSNPARTALLMFWIDHAAMQLYGYSF